MTIEKTSSKIKIGIAFGSQPKFDKNAFKFFILSINKLQSYFEFCFPVMAYEPLIYPFNSNICSFSNTDDIFKLQNYTDIKLDHWVVIISSRFDNNYFVKLGREITYITTKGWEKKYSPPSLFEYLLHTILLSILNLNSTETGTKSHEETIGCIADFSKNKEERRVCVALGYICDYHSRNILEKQDEQYLNEIKIILNKNWIGLVEEKNSVAFMLKHNFRFDIYKDSGFNKNKIEIIRDRIIDLISKISNESVRILIAALLGYLLAKYGLKK
jgi:hypothetical protein